MEKYIPGWFPAENQRILEKLIDDFCVNSVIEIGSFVGKSTAFFAERVESVIAVEPFNAINSCDYLNKDFKKLAEFQRAEFDKNLAHFGNVEVFAMTSEEAALHDIEADLVYIDGSHEYADVKTDIRLWLPKAKKILCGDDYSPWWSGVRRAVDESLKDADKSSRCWFFIK